MPAAPATDVELWLVRHGETAWSKAQRHTGRTDVPLTDDGRRQAAALRPLLAAHEWNRVFCSPLSRARETAELALPGVVPVFDDNLVERDYGPTEGISSAELRRTDPTWDSWSTEVPGAETIDQVGMRADRVIARVAGNAPTTDIHDPRGSGRPASPVMTAGTGPAPASDDDPPPAGSGGRRVLIVAHGHLLRVLAARWIGAPAVLASHLALDVASASVLGYEHDRRVITRWNVRD